MFNLLIKLNGWNPEGSDSIETARVLEYTEDSIESQLRVNGRVNFDALRTLPALLMPESPYSGDDDQVARLARITRVQQNQRTVYVEYSFDQLIPPIANDSMFEMLTLAGVLDEFERKRTHWAVKNADVYACIARAQFRHRLGPTVFQLHSMLGSRAPTVAVMMPFSSEFDCIYDCIRTSVASHNLQCQRADDIWKNESIVQDIVDLLVASSAVIVDCTGRNPNVFYEMGIAHTIGRPVVPIVQDPSDIPFDVSHLRHIRYHANREGLQQLGDEIVSRLRSLGLGS